MDDVKAGLQYLFQTSNALTFAVSGTGHAGMECALMNLLERNEKILVIQNGIWGMRAADLAKRLDFNVALLTVEHGQAATLEQFQKVILLLDKSHKFFSVNKSVGPILDIYDLTGPI